MKSIFKSDFGIRTPATFLNGNRNAYLLVLSLDPSLPVTVGLEIIKDIKFTGFEDDPTPSEPRKLKKRNCSHQIEASLAPRKKPGPKYIKLRN